MIFLDTPVWIWFLSNPNLITKKALKAIHAAEERKSIYISSISVWEIALLVQRRRLELTMEVDEWLATAQAFPFFSFIPVDNNIALKAVQLPDPLHPDPADRIIIASTINIGATLITKDKTILQYPYVKTLWN